MAVYRSLKCLGFLIPGSPVDQGTSEGSSQLEREIALGRVIFLWRVRAYGYNPGPPNMYLAENMGYSGA